MDLDNDMHESPALPSLSDSQNNVDVKLTKKNKRKRNKTNAVKSDVNACGTPENTFSSKTTTAALDICLGENEKKEQNIVSEAAEKGNGENGIQDKGCSFNSVVADAELFAKESPALPNLSDSQNNVDVKLAKKNKRKRNKTNAVKSDVNSCGTPENTFSSKTTTSALDICLGENEKKEQNIVSEAAEKGNGENGIQDKGCSFNSVVADAELFAKESPALPNLSDSQNNVDVKLAKKNKRKRNKTNADKSDVNACGTPENTFSLKTTTSALDICLGKNEKKEQNIVSEAAEKGNGENGIQDKGCSFNSVVADAELFAKESPALPNLSDSQNNVDVKLAKKNKRKRNKTNAVKSDVNACGTPENTFSSKTTTSALDICLVKNEKKEQNIVSEAAEKGNGENGIQDKGCSFNSVVADAELFAKESPALPNLSDSQNNVDVKLAKKNKRKRNKTNAIKSDVNACGTPENTFSSKTSTSALDICLGENEKKEQNIISEAAEKGNGENGIQDKGCSFNSVVADVELFAKESMSEVVKMNIEQSITANSSIPEETSDSVKNGSLVKNQDEDLEVHDLSDKPRCIKTYSRKRLNNVSCEGNLDCPSPVNCNKEPTIQDHHNDNLHEVSDGPLTDGLIEIETEHSIDQNKVKAEEIGLIAENNSEQKTLTTSSVIDIPVTQIEETNAGQVDHDEVTRNDTCCPGDVSEQKNMTSSVLDIPVTQNEETNARHVDNAEVTRNDTCCPGDVSEQKTTTTSSVVDNPVTQLEEANDRRVDHAEVTRNDTCCPGDVSDLSLVAVNGGNSKISQCSVERTIISNSKKKLLILDVNGLLADCISDVPNGYYQPEPHFWVRRRKVYKRPFCDSFLQFCFDKFHVGVWSSRAKCNVDEVIKCLMGKSASRLLFCWNQSHCTTTKFSTVENKDKPLVLKELRKLWEKSEPGLPWEKGDFNESNTLLLDDSPYKALMNPKYTAIFPYSYRYYYTRDSALGPKGDLRGYLERLAMADNVQEFVESNPFGQRAIREGNLSWGYYLKVIESVKCRENDRPSASNKEQTA